MRGGCDGPRRLTATFMNLDLLQRPLVHLAGHDISALGIIGFVAWFIGGLIAVRVLQSQWIRRVLRKLRIEPNLIAIATTVLSLVAFIFFTVSAINAAGIPLSWSKGLPAINLSLIQIFMLVALLISVFWLAAKTKRLLFDRFLKDTGLDRSLQYAISQIVSNVVLIVGIFVVWKTPVFIWGHSQFSRERLAWVSASDCRTSPAISSAAW